MSGISSSKSRSSVVNPINTAVDLIESHAIFLVDKNGCIYSWNKGAEKISGWKKDEILNKPLSILYAYDKPADNIMARQLKQASSKGAYIAEQLLLSRTGKAYLTDLSITAVNKNNKVDSFIVVANDTTQRKKNEVDQQDANTLLKREIERRKTIEKALQESNNELNAFASAAGHDLQEPLRMVVSYLQLIKKRYAQSFDKDGLEFLAFAVDGATRMKQLINDLVEYSRIETLGKPFKKTDANIVLSKVLDSLEVSIAESGAVIDHDTLPIIWSDEVQLNELFQNLVANAIKFGLKAGKKPPKIHIGVTKSHKDYVFSVSDNGPGIASKDFNTIFLIFKQLGNKLQAQGSGIGLAICKKIVKRHNGRIWVESKPGSGATFKFTIPRVKEDHE
ncbi:MAG: hypothetical protein NVS1B10_02450 [Candidatus Saccharimonadales bacterium]